MALSVSRILHAGYVFSKSDVQIAFDPIFENPFSRNCYSYPEVSFDYEKIRKLQFSAVFISHYHDDHCSFDSLKWLDRKTPIYLFCEHEEMFQWLRELGFSEVHPLYIGETVTVGEFSIRVHRALDADVDCLFQISCDEFNILNVVDSWIGPETMDVLRTEKMWDLILWPFQTMRELEVLNPEKYKNDVCEFPFEWVEQLQSLNPKFLVPSSCQFIFEEWSWYNHFYFPVSYRSFQDLMKDKIPSVQVKRINPGETFLLTTKSFGFESRIDWIEMKGDGTEDYNFDPSLDIPSTGRITEHFPKLSIEESQTVRDYCISTLLIRYRSLFSDEGSYFHSARVWRLILWISSEASAEFQYCIEGQKISLLPISDLKSDWMTEIPIYKLHSALLTGESLSSLYLRVRPPLEMDCDVLEDPLIRCLYEGKFGSYQKAQLDRILGRKSE